MSNTTTPKSFKVLGNNYYQTRFYKTESGLATSPGDVLFINSAGRATATVGTVLGIQAGTIIDAVTKTINTTAAEDDLVEVYYQPEIEFEGQISTGALTDPYTTRSSAACFDLAGTTGVQYINAAASSNDIFKVIGPAFEVKDGSDSAAGAYQKVRARFNPLVHFLGPIA